MKNMHKLLLLFLLLTPSLAASAQQTAASQEAADRLAPARALLQTGKFSEAIAVMEGLEKNHPGLKGLARELGVAHYRTSNHARAAVYLKRALDEDPDDKEVIQLLGLSYHFIGRVAEAVPLLEKARSWYPVANVDASYVLGIAYIQLKDYEKARGAFAAMFGVAADSAASHLFLARMLLRQEFDPVAEEHAQKAVALDPSLPGAHFLLGELYVYKSRIPEAIVEFEKELALNPAHAAAYYKLADAYTRILKWEEAERLLQRSLWLDSTATGPHVLMGKVLLKKGEAELAVRMLQRAARMDPANYITHHLLGQAFRELGKVQDAERELKLAQELQAAQTPGR